ncbi:allantoate deiminase [Sinobaca qinghaiensis]|uniref:Allantoate deiminase n=1 Tax=Sinobaca qinghaiensis TaxID=342944 RepID=A0A419V839_9BACL|nr:Zn-dependent hydrolase [Sinobaca qinghaiensis]RKD76222.1 allantoate deiminase [Sinobaca qinghaiensis]
MQTDNWDLYKKLLNDYSMEYSYDGISGERLASRLHALSEIGLTESGGSRRLGFSKEERQAKDLVISWMKKADLAVSEDSAGNVFGRLEGREPDLPALLSGSHVDSVPEGGHFDGPLGVLSALEVAEAWKEMGYQPKRSYEVVIFTDEEGARFNNGLTGSRAMTGEIDPSIQSGLTDQEGREFAEVLADTGLTEEGFYKAERNLSEIAAFVEVHIEQGVRLEQENLPVGIVSGIAGPSWLEVVFTGSAGHAGNTPMGERRDALVAAGEFVRNVPDIPVSVSGTAVATVGKLKVFPNGANVIPGRVEMVVDIRDIEEETRDEVVRRIMKAAEKAAALYNIECTQQQTLKVKPVPIAENLKYLLRGALESRRLRPVEMPSGAGHDAMIVGHHLPAAMLFVRSKDGISHNPAEWTSLNDGVQGVHVLKKYIESMDQ